MAARRSFLRILFAPLLAACGSPPQAEPPPPADADAPTPGEVADRRAAIVAFGDSLSAGYGVDPGQSYPDHLQKLIDAAGYPYRVINAGISGDTTSSGLARVDSIVAMKPAMVIVELGGNDGLRGLPIETTEANLGEILVRLKASGAIVALAAMTLPPNYGAAYIGQFERLYRHLAERHQVMLIPFFLEGIAGHPDRMQENGIHPTEEGNRLAAANVFRAIQPLLRH